MGEGKVWTVSLNECQRNNLLLMFNSFGYPVETLWYDRDLSDAVSIDTGDWFEEIPKLLGGVLESDASVYGCRTPEVSAKVRTLEADVERLEAVVERMRAAGDTLADVCSMFDDGQRSSAVAAWREVCDGSFN